MNNEMLLMQARQDFIDLHYDLISGERVTLERYDSIVSDLKRMDDINFSFILDYVKETEGMNIGRIWREVSAYIERSKQSGDWSYDKTRVFQWKENQFQLLDSEQRI